MQKVWLPALFSTSVLAEETVQKSESVTTAASLLNVFGSLIIVLGILFALAWFYKKLSLKLPGSGQMKVVSTMMLGPRERILVVEIQGKQRVLGVTGQQINFLFELDEPLQLEQQAVDWRQQWQQLLQGKKDKN